MRYGGGLREGGREGILSLLLYCVVVSEWDVDICIMFLLLLCYSCNECVDLMLDVVGFCFVEI